MAEEKEPIACEICKAPMVEELQDYLVEFEGQQITVEDVPIWVCEQCGYTFVEEDVAEAVEDMLEHMDTVVADTSTDVDAEQATSAS